MRLSFWRYQLILASLYLLWSGFFTMPSILSQVAFNFAVFYPVGVLAGYNNRSNGTKDVYMAAVLFNLITYWIAYLGGIIVQDWVLVIVDFLSVAVLVGIGIIIGKRLRKK